MIFELVLSDQWELAKVRNEESITELRGRWAFLGIVKLSAWPGQETQMSKWQELNLGKATGNLKGT